MQINYFKSVLTITNDYFRNKMAILVFFALKRNDHFMLNYSYCSYQMQTYPIIIKKWHKFSHAILSRKIKALIKTIHVNEVCYHSVDCTVKWFCSYHKKQK